MKAQLSVLKQQKDEPRKRTTNAQAKAGAPKKFTNPQVAQSLESLKLSMANVNAQIQARNMEMEESARNG